MIPRPPRQMAVVGPLLPFPFPQSRRSKTRKRKFGARFGAKQLVLLPYVRQRTELLLREEDLGIRTGGVQECLARGDLN